MIIYKEMKQLCNITRLLIILFLLPNLAFTQQDTLMKKYIKFKKGSAYNKESGELFSGFGFDLDRDRVVYEGNWIYGLKTGTHKEYYSDSKNWIKKEQIFEASYLEKFDKGHWEGKDLNFFTLKQEINYYSYTKHSKEEGRKEYLSVYKSAYIKHGLCKKWYVNEQLESETPYKEGKIDGLHREWYKNGQLKSEGMYEERRVTKGGSDGKIGLWKRWHENGQLESEGNYIKIVSSSANGKEDGAWRYWHDNGNLRKKGNYITGYQFGLWKSWYENGQLKEDGDYKNDYKVDLFREYESGGQLILECNYAKNNYEKSNQKNRIPKDGLCREWTKNGVLIKEINWSNNKEDGLCRRWHKKGGELREEGNYIEGKKDGLWRRRYENGQLSSEVNYINGKYEGIYRSWNRDGEISSEVEYKNGKKQYPK